MEEEEAISAFFLKEEYFPQKQVNDIGYGKQDYIQGYHKNQLFQIFRHKLTLEGSGEGWNYRGRPREDYKRQLAEELGCQLHVALQTAEEKDRLVNESYQRLV